MAEFTITRTITIYVADHDWSAEYDVPIDECQQDAERHLDPDSLAAAFYDALPALAALGGTLTVADDRIDVDRLADLLAATDTEAWRSRSFDEQARHIAGQLAGPGE